MTETREDLIPAGSANRPGWPNPMRYITIHNTGNANAGANAKNHAAYAKSAAARAIPASWHYTVDDTCAYRHIPDNEAAFHAGDGNGPGNLQSIGIEICMNKDGDLLKATDNAAGLAGALCREHGIPIENIRQHFDWSGKNCPQLLRAGLPYKWAAFLEKARAASSQPSGAAAAASFLARDGVTSDAPHWEAYLSGRINTRPEYVQAVFERYHKALENALAKTPLAAP